MFILVRLEMGITPAIEYLDLAMFVVQGWTLKKKDKKKEPANIFSTSSKICVKQILTLAC